ncbi:MAG: hypothetical protein WBD48_16175 [Pseudolabrys sp.]
MKFRWILAAAIGAAVLGAGPAAAKHEKYRKHYSRQYCKDRAHTFSWSEFLSFHQPAPAWNGCAPPVYVNGDFAGQDPDPNVRLQLQRDMGQDYHMRGP